MPEDTTKSVGMLETREYADIEVHGVRKKGGTSGTRPPFLVPMTRDWSKATRYGDFEVMEDPRVGMWIGRHRTYAFVSQGSDEKDALAATQEAVELGRTHYAARSLAMPEWA